MRVEVTAELGAECGDPLRLDVAAQLDEVVGHLTRLRLTDHGERRFADALGGAQPRRIGSHVIRQVLQDGRCLTEGLGPIPRRALALEQRGDLEQRVDGVHGHSCGVANSRLTPIHWSSFASARPSSIAADALS